MKTLSYTADAVATGDGRNGHVRTGDALVDLDLGIPQDLGGAGGHVSNPEQLFAAGYSACFLSALHSVARVQRVKLRDAQVQAKVTISGGGAGFDLAVELVVLMPDVPPETGQELLEAAHRKCPYSRAVAGNIPVTLTHRS
ncbi:organic hydroperoxide resistance protein [Nocardioides luteus]|uniref:Organic hydroperoxide resistance protein n=2 Tax=Nocardioides luteus TaxID=1844 RepID=A0A1J4N588_9ACTN|nr:Ohr family peroxiredoxin [Nocardioides luteus]OIJ26716.1 organic hydroperoxide resistance protein [Nocardioides luteus]